MAAGTLEDFSKNSIELMPRIPNYLWAVYLYIVLVFSHCKSADFLFSILLHPFIHDTALWIILNVDYKGKIKSKADLCPVDSTKK